MPAWLTAIPLWAWLIWLALVFLAAIVLAPRRRAEASHRNQRLLRVLGQVLLAVAIFTVRAETAAVATLLAALGGGLYGNASGAPPPRADPGDGRDGADVEPGTDAGTDSDDGGEPPR